MKNEDQCAQSIAVIGEADGPTGVFVVGENKKLPLKLKINNSIYQLKRKCTVRKIVAGAHTMDELIAYAVKKYGATESYNKGNAFCNDFRVYEIKVDDNCFVIEIYEDDFGVSFSGNKKEMKHFQKIARDLYTYYGVNEDDITNKSRRYLSLLSVLCS